MPGKRCCPKCGQKLAQSHRCRTIDIQCLRYAKQNRLYERARKLGLALTFEDDPGSAIVGECHLCAAYYNDGGQCDDGVPAASPHNTDWQPDIDPVAQKKYGMDDLPT